MSKRHIVHIMQFLNHGSGKGLLAILERQSAFPNVEVSLIIAQEIQPFRHSKEFLAKLEKLGIRVRFADSTFLRNSWSKDGVLSILKEVLELRRIGQIDSTRATLVSHGGFPSFILSQAKLPFVHICHGFGLNRPEWIDQQDLQGISLRSDSMRGWNFAGQNLNAGLKGII